MPQLVVRNIELPVVQKLKELALKEGVSVEEEHRRVLRRSLLKKVEKRSFIEFLQTMPEVDDTWMRRSKSGSRKIEL